MSDTDPLLPVTRGTIARGAAWTVLFFSVTVTLGYAIVAAVDSASRPHGGWGIGVTVIILVIGLPLSILMSAIVTLIVGVPLTILASHLLRRSRSPVAHATAAGLVGALIAAAAGLLVGTLLPALLVILILAGGLSAAGGWLMARRARVRSGDEARQRAVLGEPF